MKPQIPEPERRDRALGVVGTSLATLRVVVRGVHIVRAVRWATAAGLAVSLWAGTALAQADAPRATEARLRVERAAERVASAEAALRDVNARQSELEADILTLKREGATGGRLEDRLRASVRAEGELELRLQALEDARDALREVAQREVAAIDAELRRRADGLREGPAADRRRAASEIRALLEARAAILTIERSAEPEPADAPDELAQAVPTIDPLDGPEELREKADFAEDARDKLRGKRLELAKLVDQRRRTRAIARAARDFAVDVSLFDEEVRSAVGASRPSEIASRDTPQVGSGGGVSEDSAGGSDRSPGDFTDVGNGVGAESPGPDLGPDFSLDPPPSTGGPDSPTPDPGPSPSAPDPTPGTPGADPAAGGLAARGVDPVVLLSLKVDQLAGDDIDVAALERLLRDYERLEALYSARARAMRAKARRLDEAPPDE